MTNNMNFIDSNKIKVFPCGGRDSTYDANAKLTTEYNLVSIINRLVDQKSFVVSDTMPGITPGSNTFITNFVFNLNGYLFSTTDATFGDLEGGGANSRPSKNSYIVAYIDQYNYGNNDTPYIQLRPLSATKPEDPDSDSQYGGMLDTGAEFKGVGFVLIPQADIPTSTSESLGVGSYTFGFNPKSSSNATNGIIHVTKTQLPLLQFDGSSWVIPPDSKIKFRTTTDGKYRSVSIDDGELTSNDAPILPDEPSEPDDPTVEVDSVTLDKTRMTLKTGDTLNLTATVLPANATDTSVTWINSNDTVAEITTTSSSNLVKVTAKSTGTTTITAKTSNNETATCTVTVISATLNKTSATIKVDEKLQLTATVLPVDATNKTVTWKSSNENVATVSNTGLVTAIAKGNATITVTTEDGGATATCYITVNQKTIAVTSVTLDRTRMTLKAGGTETLTATISPSNATDQTVKWEVEGNGATISSTEGYTITVTAGPTAGSSATIKASCSGFTATCEVTVTATDILPTGIELDPSSINLNEGGTTQLIAIFSPDNTTDTSVEWSSNDESIATVSDTGLVTAVAVGTTSITATTHNGIPASCTISVIAPGSAPNETTINGITYTLVQED